MTFNRIRLAVAGTILAVVGSISLTAGASTVAVLDDNPSHPGDISGPCDEAEHTNDARCVGASLPASPADAPSPGVTAAPAPSVPDSSTSSTSTTSTSTTLPSSTTSTSTTSTSTTLPNQPVAATTGTVTSEAGTVSYSFDGTNFSLTDASPSAGWTMVVEQSSGFQVEVKFLQGTMRVDIEVELEHGMVRERVRTRDDADDSEVRVENGVVTRSDSDDSVSGTDDSDNYDDSDYADDDSDDDSDSDNYDDSDYADDDSDSNYDDDDSDYADSNDDDDSDYDESYD